MLTYLKVFTVSAIIFFSAACGWYVEHLRFVAFETKVVAKATEQEFKNQAFVKQQETITLGVTNDYKNKLATIKHEYANKLLNSTSSSQVPAISCTTSGTNEDTVNEVLVTQVEQLPEQCAETTQQLLSLQQWILEQGENKDNNK